MTTKKTIVAMLSGLLAGIMGSAAVLALLFAIAGLLAGTNERIGSVMHWGAIIISIPLGFGLGLLVWILILRKSNCLSWEEMDYLLGGEGSRNSDE
jgi:ABC-type multidrug transport system permease subunit